MSTPLFFSSKQRASFLDESIVEIFFLVTEESSFWNGYKILCNINILNFQVQSTDLDILLFIAEPLLFIENIMNISFGWYHIKLRAFLFGWKYQYFEISKKIDYALKIVVDLFDSVIFFANVILSPSLLKREDDIFWPKWLWFGIPKARHWRRRKIAEKW